MERLERRETGGVVKTYTSEYSSYVAQQRAIPSLVDGLKPVQRRCLNSADDLKLYHDKRFLKAAKLEGQVLGDYHPHGGASVAGMVQPFRIRYPLFEGQGNWGCPDDPNSVAASRYVETRLTQFAEDFYLSSREYSDRQPNYDGRLQEVIQYYPPIPGCLLTSAEGIAVGLTTKIPPHEVGLVCRSLLSYIKNPKSSEYVSMMAPDTCERSVLVSPREDVDRLYRTGEATLRYKAATHYEREGSELLLVVDAFPPGFSRKKLESDSILNEVTSGNLDLRNESSTGIRYVFSSKDPEVLRKVESVLESSVTYKMHIEDRGIVSLYSLKRIYEGFLTARVEYILRKYTDLLQKSEKELNFQEIYLRFNADRDNLDYICKHSYEESVEHFIKKYECNRESIVRILRSSISTLSKDHQHVIKKAISDLKKQVSEYSQYVKTPMKRIVSDIEELEKSYAGDMNCALGWESEPISLDVLYVVEPDTGSVVQTVGETLQYEYHVRADHNYYLLTDGLGIVVYDAATLSSKLGSGNLLKDSDPQKVRLYGFDEFGQIYLEWDRQTSPLKVGKWAIRKRVSRVEVSEGKGRPFEVTYLR